MSESYPQTLMALATSTDPVEAWLEHYGPETRRSYRSNWNGFYKCLQSFDSQFRGKSPRELLDYQINADRRERFHLEDLMERYAASRGGTTQSQIVTLARIRAFFLRSHAELPPSNNFSPKPTREPVQGKLNVDTVREIVTHARLRDQAIFLTMFQGLMDLERFVQFNQKYGALLVEHIKKKGLDEPFRVDFLQGRKRNRKKYHTFIYHDALAAWRKYFERIRGEPKPGEPIALSSATGRGISKAAIREAFDTVARQLKLKEAQGADPTYRSGVAPHDAFRDVTKSLLQTANKKGFDTTCADFWMGHTIDPYNYNRFAEQHPEYVLENAKIAAEYVNILSKNPAAQDQTELVKQNAELGERLKRLEELEETRKRPDELMSELMSDSEFEEYVKKKVAQLKLSKT